MSQRRQHPPRDLRDAASSLRLRLERVFAQDTALISAREDGPSAGHCAVVAAIFQEVLGGRLVSARVEGESHWFNRLPGVDATYDVDLTGDQFGRASVEIEREGGLYPDARERDGNELSEETLIRAVRLAKRAGLADVSARLHKRLTLRRPNEREST